MRFNVKILIFLVIDAVVVGEGKRGRERRKGKKEKKSRAMSSSNSDDTWCH